MGLERKQNGAVLRKIRWGSPFRPADEFDGNVLDESLYIWD